MQFTESDDLGRFTHCAVKVSQPAGCRPTMRIKSIVPSVWPRRVNTLLLRARNGNTWPGRARSEATAPGFAAVFIVVTRSWAETPVVTPTFASIETVKAVWLALLLLTIGSVL